MDEVFGDTAGTAVADQERQAAISQRIGLAAYSAGEKYDPDDADTGGKS
jgi:hypothetical protein